EMPRFPGCEDLSTENEKKVCALRALGDYIEHHPKYNEVNSRLGSEATFMAEFIVRRNGTVENVRLARSVSDNPEIYNAVIDLVKDMPTWTPGKQQGKAVDVQLTIPVRFGPQ
ncbi:MAG: TonB family protein, partial [Saprospiraceae bacterium]|nr:TonB family protein [Saprospiraceae bacterium]